MGLGAVAGIQSSTQHNLAVTSSETTHIIELQIHLPPAGQNPAGQSLGNASVWNFWSRSTNAG
jgi:hypothetical protein